MTTMTALNEKYQRVSKSALDLIATDLLKRYRSVETKNLLENGLGHMVGELKSKADVIQILGNASTTSSVSYFLKLLEHITNPLLFAHDSKMADRVLKNYQETLYKENFYHENGNWYVGPSEDEEAASIAGDLYYWRNSKGEVLEPKVSLYIHPGDNQWVSKSYDNRDFYYAGQKIKWGYSTDIYKAFKTLFESVNDEGFVSHEDFENAFKKAYPIDHNRIANFRSWMLKNLTQKKEGVLKKTGDPNLVVSVRRLGLQFNNTKLP